MKVNLHAPQVRTRIPDSYIFRICVSASLLLVHCGTWSGNPPKPDPKNNQQIQAPSDSSGTEISTSLSFSSTAATAPTTSLWNISATEPQADVGNGIVLTQAQAVIGSIKIKPDRLENQADSDLENEIKERTALENDKIKDNEEKFDAQLEDIKKQYEDLFENAQSDVEKNELERQQQQALLPVKRDIAVLKSSVESTLADYELERDGNMKWKGPYIYNLLSGETTPPLPPAMVLDGSYRRIEFKLMPHRDADGVSELLNHAVHIAGTVAINGDQIPFICDISQGLQLKLRGEQGLTFEDGGNNALVISFDPKAWFKDVDFSKATRNAFGVLVIDDDSNKEIMEKILGNIIRNIGFGKDRDGDGSLDDHEKGGNGEQQSVEEAVESKQKQASENSSKEPETPDSNEIKGNP